MEYTGQDDRSVTPAGQPESLTQSSTQSVPAQLPPSHGWYSYKRGLCRCEVCREAQRKRMARYRANRRQRESVAA